MYDIKSCCAVSCSIDKKIPLLTWKFYHSISCAKEMMNLFARYSGHHEAAELLPFVIDNVERPCCAFFDLRCGARGLVFELRDFGVRRWLVVNLCHQIFGTIHRKDAPFAAGATDLPAQSDRYTLLINQHSAKTMAVYDRPRLMFCHR